MDGGFSPFHSRKRPEWHEEPIRSHRQTDTLLTALALEPGATSRYKRHWGRRATSQHYHPPDGPPEHYAALGTEVRRYSRCYTASCPNTWSRTHTSQSRAAQRNKERDPAHSCHLHKKVSDCCQQTKQPARNALNGTWSKKTPWPAGYVILSSHLKQKEPEFFRNTQLLQMLSTPGDVA